MNVVEVQNIEAQGRSAIAQTNRYLTNIKQADLLTPELLKRVQTMLPELKHNFETQTIWRTETEIRYSVLNDKDFPDKAAKYHQAKIEQNVFFEQLLILSFDYRKHQEKIEIKEAEIEEIDFKLSQHGLKSFEIKKLNAEKRIKEIELQELVYGLENMRKQGEERVRELEIWSKIKDELDDGTFDKDSKDANQLISLTRRYCQEAFNAVQIQGTDIASFNNVISQFEMLCKECIARGIFEKEILMHFGINSTLSQWLIQYFGLRSKQ